MLLSMQKKLDSLCDQLNNIKEQPQQQPSSENFASDKFKIMSCGCWQCDQHQGFSNNLMVRNLIMWLLNWVLYLIWVFGNGSQAFSFDCLTGNLILSSFLLLQDNLFNKTSSADEIFKYKMEAEPEERRMSDLSWNSSVTSSIEIQVFLAFGFPVNVCILHGVITYYLG